MSTLTDDPKQDDKLNPSSQAANALSSFEQRAGTGIDQLERYANDPKNSSKNIDNVKSSEETTQNGLGGNPLNYVPGPTALAKKNPIVRLVGNKKGPLGFLGGIIAAAFGMIAFFGGPSMLLVHMSEVFSDALDQQHPVLETRYRKITIAKLQNNTKGVCSSVASFRCKYGSFTERELANFRKNGVEVLDEKGKPLLDENNKIKERGVKAGSMEFNGERIPATGYQKALRSNVGFRNANINSLNTKFIGLFDNKFTDYFRSVRASKGAPFKGAKSDEERDKILVTETKNGVPNDRIPRAAQSAECDADCVAEQNARADEADKLATEAEKNATDNIRNAKPGMLKKIVGAANSLSVLNDYCAIPTAVNAVGMGAKVVRNAQMVRYAAKFLALGSMIKAGEASADDIEYAGNTLTKTVTDQDTGEQTLSATDSFAFKNAAYGDKGISESAALALGAAGLGGALEGISTKMLNAVGGEKTCKVANNPAVQAGGVLVSLIPGAGVAAKAGGAGIKAVVAAALKQMLSKELAKSAAKSIGENIALAYLLQYVVNIGIDIVSGAGVDSNSMYGELAGDWMGSGTDEMFSGANGMGGALPLTPQQAAASEPTNKTVAAEYATATASIANPFDVYDSHSFLGSTFQTMFKSTGSISSLSSALLAPQRIIGATLGLGTADAHAVSQKDFETCEDYRYRKENIATSAMCHVVRGIPAEYINLDPNVVANKLFSEGQIDEEGAIVPGSDYATFAENCFNNKVVGESEADGGDGNDCQIKDSDSQTRKDQKGYYAVHYVDERLTEVAENGITTQSTQAQGAGNFTVGTYNLLNTDGHADKSRQIAGSYCKQATDKDCADARADLQSKIILGNVKPYPQIDLLGTQETSSEQFRALMKRLPGYASVPYDDAGIRKLTQQNAGAVSIIWNTQKFTKFDDGYAPAISNVGSGGDKGDINTPWVGLQDTAGNKYYVMSLHFPTEPYGGAANRLKVGVNLALDFAKQKEAEGGIVLLMGDLNDHTNEKKTYCWFTQGGLFQNSHDMALGDPVNTPCPNPTPDFDIDHVYVSTKHGLTASSWTHLPREKNASKSKKDEYPLVYHASDHTPMTVNLALPGASDSGTGASGWVWPTNGPITNGNCYDVGVGSLGSHAGMDINSLSTDLKVMAMSNGTVVQKGFDDAAGNYLIVKATDGTFYGYQHLKNPVTVSGAVKSGQVIGIAGKTGRVFLRSSNAHLHITMAKTQTLGAYGNHPNNFDPMTKLSGVKPNNYNCIK